MNFLFQLLTKREGKPGLDEHRVHIHLRRFKSSDTSTSFNKLLVVYSEDNLSWQTDRQTPTLTTERFQENISHQT